MTRSLSILVDLDSTLVEILPKWLDWSWQLREGGAPRPTIADITEWNSPHLDLPVLKMPNFFANLPPMPGGLGAMRKLHDAGHRITVCTAPASPESAMHKLIWVREHLSFLNYKHTIITQKKELVAADVLIDDSPSMHKAYRAAHGASYIASIQFPYHTEKSYNLINCLAPSWDKPIPAWELIVDGIEKYAAGAINDRCTHPQVDRGNEFSLDRCSTCYKEVYG
ncbi:MAG: hypothetical protein Q7R39_11040 [Dehalococcoidia bacterium]|nr:hypothetical protein [Dehalococcoidia bacterium]